MNEFRKKYGEIPKEYLDYNLKWEDLPSFLDFFVKFSNESEDLQDEIEGFNIIYKFHIKDTPENEWFWISIENGIFNTGMGNNTNADIIFQGTKNLILRIITQETDLPTEYMSKKLSVTGSLEDLQKFHIILELFYEELTDLSTYDRSVKYSE
ncbi:MAG: SCP2 sterol-binding domain-containing protein [Candidatus Helarchaeota archaeon]|nr:SCP2 sterol-binding domain-containing protein [Candidatus Helarchaeota archaeon]